MSAARRTRPATAKRSAKPRRAVPVHPRAIELLVLDVDGVLTDGRLYFGATGERLQAFHVRDGHGIKALQAAGVAVAIVSGRDSPAVVARCAELGIGLLRQGVTDKAQAVHELCTELAIDARQVACLGDDTPDATMMRVVGLPCAVRDAHADALKAARRITRAGGGRGAVREICDWLCAARSGADSG